MSCLTQRDLIAYMEDKLSPRDKRELESHLDHCVHCQRQLEHFVDGLDQADEALWGDLLPKHLDQKIIRSLSAHPVRVLSPTALSYEQPLWKKRSIAIMKRTTIAAAAIALAISGGMLISPSFAQYVNAAISSSTLQKDLPGNAVSKSKFADVGDRGIQVAAQNGFAVPIGASVTDQGITFEVQEVVADPLRISMMVTVKDKNGRFMDLGWNDLYERADKEPAITLKDKLGNILKSSRNAEDRNPNEYWDSYTYPDDGFLILNRELRSYFDDPKQIPDVLVVEFTINKISDRKGNWKLSVPVDMKKAKAATHIQEINKTYTTPQGLTLDVKQMTFAPSGIELVIDRSAKTDERSGYSYQLVDEQGEVLGSWDSADAWKIPKNQSHVNGRVNWRKSLPTQNGVRDFQYFYPIDDDKGISFELESVYYEEPAAFRVKLDLDRMEKETVTAEEKGDRFTFKKYVRKPEDIVDFEEGRGDLLQVNPDGTTSKIEAYHLAYDGLLGESTAPMYPFDAWSITDENGKEREVQFLIDKTEYKNGRMIVQGGMLVFKPLPKQLTISYDKKMTENRNVDWEIPIVAGK